MELRHVRYALTLAEHGHFGRAAQALGIRQPPLSAQIKALEAEVGARLFDRTPRGVVPTAAGEAFLTRARAGVVEFAAAAQDAVAAAEGTTGTLRLGLQPSALTEVLPEVLAAFAEAFPHVRVETRTEGATAQLAALADGRLDAAVLIGPVPRDTFTTTVLTREDLLAAVGRHDRAARRSWVRAADLAGRTLILPPRDLETAVVDAALRACHRAGFEPPRMVEAGDWFTALGLAASGVGVAIGPSLLRHARRDDVAVLELDPAPPSLTVHLVLRRGETEPLPRHLRRIAHRVAEGAKSAVLA